MAIKSVGVIGVGTMGAPLAGHLLKGGYTVTVSDPNRESVDALVCNGAKSAGSAKELAEQSELTLVIVADDAQVQEVCLGPQGILAAARPDHIIAICSTVQPATCRMVADAARAQGIHVLDTPMSRGVAGAVEGTLLLTVGGDAGILERCRPAFSTFATDICRLGDIGSGQVGKIVNNLVLWANVVVVREGLTLAASNGLDLATLREALIKSSADNFVLRHWDNVAGQPSWWDQKDLKAVLELAAERGVAAPVATVTKELINGFTAEQARKLLPIQVKNK